VQLKQKNYEPKAKSQKPVSNKKATRQGGSDSEFGFLEWRGAQAGAPIQARFWLDGAEKPSPAFD